MRSVHWISWVETKGLSMSDGSYEAVFGIYGVVIGLVPEDLLADAGIPSDQQRLIFSSKRLENVRNLAVYGVNKK
jgi:hypothetical protein